MSTVRRATGALLSLALLGGLAATATAAAAVPAAPVDGYIVRAAAGHVPAVAARVEALGGDVTRTLGIIDAVAVDATPAVAAQLRRDPLVTEVVEDAPVELASTTYDPVSDTGSMYNASRAPATSGRR